MATLPNTSIGYDQQVIFQPNENISAVDASNIAFFSWQTLKNFVNVFVSPTACRAAGFVPTFLGNSTPSPSIQLSGPGLVLVSLPQPWSTNDPNSYSGALFYIPAGFASIGITPPGSGSRIDSLDLVYSEVVGGSTGRGFPDLRDQIETDGTILLNQNFYTRNISNYQISYIQNSNITPPVAGAIRLTTFTVSNSGTCNTTFLLPSIWDNQQWPGNTISTGSVLPIVTAAAGTPNYPEQSQSLYDNLASLRYQINAIIGQTHWYDQPYLSLAQIGNAPQYWGGSDTSGTPGTITLTIPNYQTPIKAGTSIKFIVNNTNPSTVQVNINASGNVAVTNPDNVAFSGGYFVAGNLFEIVYNGTNYQTVNTADGQSVKTYYGGTAGANNAISLTIPGYPTTVPPGTVVEFKANSSPNSSSMTMSINGSSPVALNNSINNGFGGGEITANATYQTVFNGSNYQVLGIFPLNPGFANIASYFSSGNQSFTVPPGRNKIWVKLWGAGAGSNGGGNCDAGGGGGYCESLISANPGDTISGSNFHVGAGGGGGGNGEDSIFNYNGVNMTAGGGTNGGGHDGTNHKDGGSASGGNMWNSSGSAGIVFGGGGNIALGGTAANGASQVTGGTGWTNGGNINRDGLTPGGGAACGNTGTNGGNGGCLIIY